MTLVFCFCAIVCFYFTADPLADYISALARKIEAEADLIRKEKERKRSEYKLKNENPD